MRLRRLAQMGDSGIVTGYVTRPVWHDDDKYLDSTYPPNHKVVAKRVSDGIEGDTLTDSPGDFEFELLPSGSYDFTANTATGFWAEGGRTKLQPRDCTSIGFEIHTDGRILGRLSTPDGEPSKAASQKTTGNRP